MENYQDPNFYHTANGDDTQLILYDDPYDPQEVASTTDASTSV